MQSICKKVCPAVVAFLVCLSGVKAADDMPVENLPAEVKNALKEKYADAKVLKAVHDPGKHIMVTIETAEGPVEIVFKADTKYRFHSLGVPLDTLPTKILDVLRKEYKGHKIQRADKVVNAKGEVVGYQFVISHRNKSVDVTMMLDGKLFRSHK